MYFGYDFHKFDGDFTWMYLRVIISFVEPIIIIEVVVVNVMESGFGFVPQLKTRFGASDWHTNSRQS